ncbi:MAG: hypothetical protein RR547_03465 [Raoultibacter sp.]
MKLILKDGTALEIERYMQTVNADTTRHDCYFVDSNQSINDLRAALTDDNLSAATIARRGGDIALAPCVVEHVGKSVEESTAMVSASMIES